jgi:hypothetical protein
VRLQCGTFVKTPDLFAPKWVDELEAPALIPAGDLMFGRFMPTEGRIACSLQFVEVREMTCMILINKNFCSGEFVTIR